MKKQTKTWLWILGVVVFVIIIFSFSREALIIADIPDGSISGTIFPAEEGTKVRLVKDLSLVSETYTETNGNYVFNNLAPGKYGLFIIRDNGGYVYNDEINTELAKRIEGSDRIIMTIKETIGYKSSNVDFNISDENLDYVYERVIVKFKENVSEEKINEIINSYDCTIEEKYVRPYGDYYATYILLIPSDKTVFEIMRDFNLEEDVEYSEWSGFIGTGGGGASSGSQVQCEVAGGNWETETYGCGDSCDLVRDNELVGCTGEFKIGCDCGPDKCWNGETCELN